MSPSDTQSFGADLRALRRARGLRLSDMARALGRSVGWLSQVERNLSVPGQDDLERIAHHLDVPLAMLSHRGLDSGAAATRVVRADTRRPVGHRNAGLVEGLLSPDLTDDFEVVHSTFAPGAALSRAIARPTQELGYMVSGQLDLTISGHAFTVGPGDSFRIRHEPYHWANPYDIPAVAIWVIAPPVY